MPGVAYSYLRFSTPEQAQGDSRRRQATLAEAYAKAHGLLLDRSLNFRDLGVSAFRGRNAKQGGLRAFLDAIEYGLVPKDSFLLIESLDRLSRDQILAAQGLFLQIVNAGVTIVTLIDQRSYSAASLNANPTDLIVSLVYMMRANEESATKATRIRAAIGARQSDPEVHYHGRQCPAWLKANPATKTYEVIEEKAEIVRQIYKQSLAGEGTLTITQRLNLEQVPMFGRGNQKGKMWQRAIIRHLLRTPLVIGTYTPCTGVVVDGKVRFVPQEPKPNYYPAIVDPEDYETIQVRRRASAKQCGSDAIRKQTKNVLSRLAKCPKCDRPMILSRTAEPNQRYLVCMAWREGRACSNEWVRFPEIEDVFISDVEFLIERCPQPLLHKDNRRAMLRNIRARLAYLRQRLKGEQNTREILRVSNRPGRTAALDTQREIDDLLSQRYRLRLDRSYWQDATLGLKLDALRSAVASKSQNIEVINECLRALLLKVVVDWENARLLLHWRHGGITQAGFWRKRQHGTTRNPTIAMPKTRWPGMPPIKAGSA